MSLDCLMWRKISLLHGGFLLEKSAVLLLETTNLIHVDGVESALGLLLVSGQLLIVHRLQTDSGVVTDTDVEDAATLGAALVVLLVGEGDVDFWHVIRGVRGRVGVGEHGLAVTADVDHARAAVVRSLDGETVRVVITANMVLRVVVRRKGLSLHTLVHPVSAEEEEAGS